MSDQQFYWIVATNVFSMLGGVVVVYGRLVKVETKVEVMMKKIFDKKE